MNPLYAYLYDDFLSDKAYERVLANIETRCSVLGIQGRTARLAIFRSARELVEGLVKDGAKTIVIVGNDKSLQKTMWFLPDLPVTVGYIPVAEPSRIATLLGIPHGEAACDVLAARRMEELDIGTIEDRYFLTEVRLEMTKAGVQIDQYRIAPRDAGTVLIRNVGMKRDGQIDANPLDGLLDVIICPRPTEEEVVDPFPNIPAFLQPPELLRAIGRTKPYVPPPEEGTRLMLPEARIVSDEPVDAVVDGYAMNGFTFRVGVIPKKLRMITGREKRIGTPAPTKPLPEPEKTGTVSGARQLMHRWRNWYTR